jgi:hypothetical protein
MNVVFGAALAGVPLGVLAISGVAHTRGLRSLRDDLTTHDLLPRRLIGPGAISLVLAELFLGVGGIWAWVEGDTSRASQFLVGAAILYSLFAAYSTVVLKVRPGVWCGCGHIDTRISALIPGRAVLLAALGAWAATDPPTVSPLDGPYRVLLAMLPVVTFVALARIIPSAVDSPAINRRIEVGGQQVLT